MGGFYTPPTLVPLRGMTSWGTLFSVFLARESSALRPHVSGKADPPFSGPPRQRSLGPKNLPISLSERLRSLGPEFSKTQNMGLGTADFFWHPCHFIFFSPGYGKGVLPLMKEPLYPNPFSPKLIKGKRGFMGVLAIFRGPTPNYL